MDDTKDWEDLWEHDLEDPKWLSEVVDYLVDNMETEVEHVWKEDWEDILNYSTERDTDGTEG